jgi:hypothetical protein
MEIGISYLVRIEMDKKEALRNQQRNKCRKTSSCLFTITCTIAVIILSNKIEVTSRLYFFSCKSSKQFKLFESIIFNILNKFWSAAIGQN